jgi:O-antigen ligase
MGGSAPVARRGPSRVAAAAGLTGVVALIALAYRASPGGTFALLVLAALPAAAYVAWWTEPAVLLAGGISLSIFSSNWGNLGLPELVAPDRLLISAAVATVLLRAPGVRSAARIELRPIHGLLVATVVYVILSAIASGTVDKAAMLRLADRVGAVPFLLFALAPVIFPSARQRSVLLVGLVAVGFYISVTAFFEITGLTGLVFPRYINNPAIGIHSTRARGPFLEAVANGTAIYIGLVASVVAAATWKSRWARRFAGLTAAICAAAVVLTLTRSIWVGAALATTITMLAHRSMRRWLLPVALGVTLTTAVTIAVIPGLSAQVQARESQRGPIYDRLNLNRTALTMLEARPLFGFGWDRFPDYGRDYFRITDIPVTAGVGVGVHNGYLSHLAELGLVGTSLWLLSTILAVWLALSRRGPPELEPWRYGLLAITVLNFVVAAFVYPYLFSIVVLWTWAGILYGAAQPQLR